MFQLAVLPYHEYIITRWRFFSSLALVPFIYSLIIRLSLAHRHLRCGRRALWQLATLAVNVLLCNRKLRWNCTAKEISLPMYLYNWRH